MAWLYFRLFHFPFILIHLKVGTKYDLDWNYTICSGEEKGKLMGLSLKVKIFHSFHCNEKVIDLKDFFP